MITTRAVSRRLDVVDGMQQAMSYADTLQIPFVFSAIGGGFVFHVWDDRRKR
jgi:type I site-specific restriction endonuclease